MQKNACHEALKPLTWLIGKWRSIQAKGIYPTIEPFSYCEEITFECIGQPMLNYTAQSWHPIKMHPMHLESGFLRIQPGSNKVAFLVAHNFGLTTVEEGTIVDTNLQIKTIQVSRMSFGKEPAVTNLERNYKLNEDGNLEVVVLMETNKTPLTEHLRAIYKKM